MSAKMRPRLGSGSIVTNRHAHYAYSIEKIYQAGVALLGWEVKSLRAKRVQLRDSFIIWQRGEAWLLNMLITPLGHAHAKEGLQPRRSRKLLLHRKEISTLHAELQQKGFTAVPLELHWQGNLVKVKFALARGKKTHDKRRSERDRDWQRQRQRLVKANN